ncbi:hypothetical protein GCM10010211_84970 [Streptomyces albospinus]|uniref:Uncharacterized protein n=1 Tax=Streptomyces albospinus TaxID=285515 RepID=A0ABQ2VRV8_9ACTN|nr:hypothetical protein GCM10010211_84970 [Streptomyces albospinus]
MATCSRPDGNTVLGRSIRTPADCRAGRPLAGRRAGRRGTGDGQDLVNEVGESHAVSVSASDRTARRRIHVARKARRLPTLTAPQPPLRPGRPGRSVHEGERFGTAYTTGCS